MLIRGATAIFMLALPFVSLAADDCDEPTKATNKRARIAAPIHYANTIAIFADDNGIACVTFRCPPATERKVAATSDLVEYRYRHRSNDGTETTGEGLLYENYKRDDGDANGVVDDGGQLKVLAGHFQVLWSKGDMKQGWLYYTPEELRVQFATLRDFDELELSRFGYCNQRTTP